MALDRLTATMLELWREDLRQGVRRTLGRSPDIQVSADPAKPGMDHTVVSVHELVKAAQESGVQPIPPELQPVADAYDHALLEQQYPPLWGVAPQFLAQPPIQFRVFNVHALPSYERINWPLDDSESAPPVRRIEVEALPRNIEMRSEECARKLIQDVLQPAEYQQFCDKDYIEISGKAWLYRIRRGGQTQLRALTCGCLKATACLELSGIGHHYPVEDRMVAEYLLLKNDEQHYLHTANIGWLDDEHIDALNNRPSLLQQQEERSMRRDTAARERFDGGRQLRDPIQYSYISGISPPDGY